MKLQIAIDIRREIGHNPEIPVIVAGSQTSMRTCSHSHYDNLNEGMHDEQ